MHEIYRIVGHEGAWHADQEAGYGNALYDQAKPHSKRL